MEPDFKIPYKETVFHIFGIDGLTFDELLSVASKYCSDDGFTGQILVNKKRDDADSTDYEAILTEDSAQGVYLTLMKEEHTHLHIDLPWLGSVGDVELAFAFMHAVKELYPDSGIFYNDNFDGQFSLEEQNFESMIIMRIRNMKALIQSAHDGEHVGAQGINHQYIIPSLENSADKDIDDVVMDATNRFLEIQWNYNDCYNASLANIESPDGEKYTTRLLTNANDTFAGVSQRVTISNSEGSIKNIPAQDFIEHMEGNPYFERVDACQFVLRKMSDDEWEELYDSLEGKELHAPKTYVLRWNPSISSFKIEHYVKALKEHPDGFGTNWSVYEWKDAHEGDRFYMERVGEGNTGIIFRGVFTSEPYKDEDWSGRGRECYYVDIDCFDACSPDAPAHITVDELEQAIPDINWRKGHSGQLLTKKQAKKLDDLWDKKVGE